MNRRNGHLPKPFLKWAGGKGQLLDEIGGRICALGGFGRYHEPFVGGGAVYFYLARERRLGRKHPFISDSNQNLIVAYEGIRRDLDAVILQLREHARAHSKEYYYRVRSEVPADRTAQAARVIYLNRTCFNGLYRENSRGEFNVPMGRYTDPKILDEPNLRAVAKALQKTKIEAREFSSVTAKAEAGDLVYFDPPYVPVSKTANFTAYSKSPFGPEQQRELAEAFAALDQKGVYVILSNSESDVVRKLYRRFRVERVEAIRAVNSRADRRGAVGELIVRNF